MIHEIIENVVENDYCDFLSNKLPSASWKITENDKSTRSDTGMLFSVVDVEFKTYADYLIESYFLKSNFVYENVTITKIFYNYYNQSSSGVYHQNHNEENIMSLIITLNDCDGGTYVGNGFIPSEKGKLIAFDSTDKHRSVGPKKHKQSYVLNVMFSYDSKTRKT